MGLIDRLRSTFAPVPVEDRSGWWPEVPSFNFNGVTYPYGLQQTLTGTREEIGSDFLGLGAGALKANPVVFACMQARASLFSEARFMYRKVRSGTPGELWSAPELDLLRHPWPGATTGDLLARTMQDADLAGNAFWVRRPNRLARLRPDWVLFIHGSFSDPQMDMWDPDAELLGYIYHPGGMGVGKPVFYQASEVAHFGPIPDPIAPARGMSWLTPLIREVQADSQMTTHKQSFLVNGATPNLVVTGVPGNSLTTYQEWVDKFSAKHDGAANAYRSLYLTPAMDAKVIGTDMAQLDFKAVQGLGETRIAAAAGVPAAVVGISEGLAGSSLNAGNFASSMRRFADLTMRPLWRNVSGSLEQIIRVPGDSELWYDDRDISALKDDISDAAEVRAKNAQAIRSLVDAGFEPESVVAAINAGDLKRLKHTGLYSVQLQPPGTTTPDPVPDPVAPVPVADPPKRDVELLRLLDLSERRTDAAERRAEIIPAAPVINVTTPDVTVHPADVTVTIERGAVEIAPAVVNVTTPEVTVAAPEVRNEITVEPTPIEITNAIPEQRPVTKTIVREGGQITQIIEEPTDG